MSFPMDSSSCLISRLPREVFDLILEVLRPSGLPDMYPRLPRNDFSSDNTALACCSLVCKAWRDSSRRHLFHSITFSFSAHKPYDEDDFGGFSLSALEPDEVDIAIPGHGRTLDDFVVFLQDHKELAQYISTLSLVMDRFDPFDVFTLGNIKFPTPSVFLDIFTALRPFGRLKTLNLGRMFVDTVAVRPPRAVLKEALPELDTLCISYSGTSMTNPAQLRNILSMFTSLRKLSFVETQFIPETSVSIIPEDVHATELEIFSTPRIQFFEPPPSGGVPLASIFRSLRLLVLKSFGRPTYATPEIINRILLESGHILEEFHYDQFLCISDDEIEDDFGLQLSKCTALRTLVLTFPVHPVGLSPNQEPANRRTWRGITQFLTYSPPPNVEHIDIFVDQGRGDFKRFAYLSLGNVAFEKALIQMSSLKTVHVEPCFTQHLAIHRRQGGVKWNEWLDPELPMMFLAGMLFLDKPKVWIGGDNSLYDVAMSFGREVPESEKGTFQWRFMQERELKSEAHQSGGD